MKYRKDIHHENLTILSRSYQRTSFILGYKYKILLDTTYYPIPLFRGKKYWIAKVKKLLLGLKR
jgi:hypothetical protein